MEVVFYINFQKNNIYCDMNMAVLVESLFVFYAPKIVINIYNRYYFFVSEKNNNPKLLKKNKKNNCLLYIITK